MFLSTGEIKQKSSNVRNAQREIPFLWECVYPAESGLEDSLSFSPPPSPKGENYNEVFVITSTRWDV